MNDQKREILFSIVIPCYNRLELLSNTLRAVLAQTYTNFEVWIIDDGSPIPVSSSLDPLLTSDSRIHIHRQLNQERGASRNKGYSLSRGEYVVFLDSDDIPLPEYIRLLNDTVYQQGFPALVATHFSFINEHGSRRRSSIQDLAEGYYDYRLFLQGNPIACNFAVKKGLPGYLPFEEDRRFSIKEDWMFLIANTRNHSIYLKATIGMYMLDHPGRSMHSDHAMFIVKTRLAADWIIEHVKLSEPERCQLRAHTAYISAIHRYLEGKHSEVVSELGAAVKLSGLRRKYAILYLKSLLGYRLIQRIRGR